MNEQSFPGWWKPSDADLANPLYGPAILRSVNQGCQPQMNRYADPHNTCLAPQQCKCTCKTCRRK